MSHENGDPVGRMAPIATATALAWLILAFPGCKAQPQNKRPGTPATSPAQSTTLDMEAEAIDFELHFERTGCLGTCPVYELHVDGSGGVLWIGHANVQALGKRRKVASPEVLRMLIANLHVARFFELTSDAQVPTSTTKSTDATGRTTWTMPQAVICSDTSHALTRARVGSVENSVENAHCQQGGMDLFEAQVDILLEAEDWIGPDTVRTPKLIMPKTSSE